MTQQEKAYDIVRKIGSATLFTRFNGSNTIEKEEAKLYALVAVDEILKSIVPKDDDERLVYELGGNQFYWQEVKQEIEKL